MAALKSRGIMQQKEPGLFTLRLWIVGGRVDASALERWPESRPPTDAVTSTLRYVRESKYLTCVSMT